MLTDCLTSAAGRQDSVEDSFGAPTRALGIGAGQPRRLSQSGRRDGAESRKQEAGSTSFATG